MATVNRIRGPTPLRPGLMLQRPWAPPRFAQAASHRSPYVIYRNHPQRYAYKHVGPSATRSIFTSPWKAASRLPPVAAPTPDYEFIRTASSAPIIHSDAPNLSLSEKPIVVIDSYDSSPNTNTATEATKPVYEVTEKYPEPPIYQMSPKIEPPIGFSKPTSLNQAEMQNLRNNVALQLASEYGLSALALPQSPIVPQQFSVQGYNRMPTHQDLLHTGTEGIIIPPNALYQPDPLFLQKLQTQLLQQFPAVEFIPYAADYPPQHQTQAPQEQNNLFLLENEQYIKQPPSSFVPSNSEVHKNLVQRETQEGTVLTLLPQGFSANNVTEDSLDVTTTLHPENVTLELNTNEVTHSPTTTISHVVEANTEDHKTTPIYYAQVGQSVGNVIANGFYSAINDVRAAAALAQVEKAQEIPKAQPFNTTTTSTTTTTTTLQPNLKAYFVQNSDNNEKNQTIGELKPLLGAPFEKPAESVNVAYTLLRADKDKQATKDGVVYAGQLVEATISEDQDYNKEKANIFARRPPIRLFALPEKRTTEAPQKVTVVKAKIPPKSKLTFDDKTGEPVLRIYASYLDSPVQKERMTSKLANMKHVNEAVTRKHDVPAPVKALDKTQGSERNQVTQFGLKLRSRSDDYIPLFEDYGE
ncbi:uncharacterized protein [Epargyreus clarus]|uniref:uncharacterized protein isoform X2 n=1 Tax=Epargyreus clarus TaxID=520877 RepID=UPI003C2B7D65